jgi:predicted transcriptional regulator
MLPQIPFRLEPEIAERLRELAHRTRQPMNKHANAALLRYLDASEAEEQQARAAECQDPEVP